MASRAKAADGGLRDVFLRLAGGGSEALPADPAALAERFSSAGIPVTRRQVDAFLRPVAADTARDQASGTGIDYATFVQLAAPRAFSAAAAAMARQHAGELPNGGDRDAAVAALPSTSLLSPLPVGAGSRAALKDTGAGARPLLGGASGEGFGRYGAAVDAQRELAHVGLPATSADFVRKTNSSDTGLGFEATMRLASPAHVRTVLQRQQQQRQGAQAEEGPPAEPTAGPGDREGEGEASASLRLLAGNDDSVGGGSRVLNRDSRGLFDLVDTSAAGLFPTKPDRRGRRMSQEYLSLARDHVQGLMRQEADAPPAAAATEGPGGSPLQRQPRGRSSLPQQQAHRARGGGVASSLPPPAGRLQFGGPATTPSPTAAASDRRSGFYDDTGASRRSSLAGSDAGAGEAGAASRLPPPQASAMRGFVSTSRAAQAWAASRAAREAAAAAPAFGAASDFPERRTSGRRRAASAEPRPYAATSASAGRSCGGGGLALGEGGGDASLGHAAKARRATAAPGSPGRSDATAGLVPALPPSAGAGGGVEPSQQQQQPMSSRLVRVLQRADLDRTGVALPAAAAMRSAGVGSPQQASVRAEASQVMAADGAFGGRKRHAGGSWSFNGEAGAVFASPGYAALEPEQLREARARARKYPHLYGPHAAGAAAGGGAVPQPAPVPHPAAAAAAADTTTPARMPAAVGLAGLPTARLSPADTAAGQSRRRLDASAHAYMHGGHGIFASAQR